MTIGVEGAMQGRCANHVESVAVGTCERCGSYYCASCYKLLRDKRICSACLALPGIDYLTDARDKAWGKRDAWIWYLGIVFSLSYAVIGVQGILQRSSPVVALAATGLAMMVAYFLMIPWSRWALFLLIPLNVAIVLLMHPAEVDQDANAMANYAGVITGRSIGLIVLLFAALESTRNKLAFKIEVSDKELAKYYDKYVANPSARRALVYGLLSLPIPLLIPVAVVFAKRSLRRIDAKAWPPVTGRGSTIAGLVAAGLSALSWIGVFVAGVLHRVPH